MPASACILGNCHLACVGVALKGFMKKIDGITFYIAKEFMELPLPDDLFSFDGNGYVDVRWGGYEYSIALDRIQTPEHLLAWIRHLGEKGWDEMTPWRISSFIRAICSKKGWDAFNTP